MTLSLVEHTTPQGTHVFHVTSSDVSSPMFLLARNRPGFARRPQPGNVVIDASDGWGDTALYFANLVQMADDTGQVHIFEFDEKQLNSFEQSCPADPELAKHVTFVKATQKSSNTDAMTLTVDDYAEQAALSRLDWIKVDIKDADLTVLKGAEHSLHRFRPTLWLSISPNPEDFHEVANWINNLGPDYHFYVDHITTLAEDLAEVTASRKKYTTL